MKYGAIPENIVERLVLMSGKVPIPMIDALFTLMKARSLMAGVSLGVFEAMRDGWHTAAELAERLSLNAECLNMLLRTFVYSDYVSQRGNRYALSNMGRRSLVRGAEMDQTGFVMWNYTQWELVEHMEELIRTGKGVDFHATMKDPVAWGYYQRGMMDTARIDAPVLAAKLPVPADAQRMLDLGGSHGLFSAAVCRKHPPLKSIVIDLPEAIDAARELAKEARIDEFVEHRAGDVLTCDLETGVDVVLLSNVTHHFTPDQVRGLLQRVYGALRPGGTAAIWDLELPAETDRASEGDGAALFFRLTSSAATYRGEDYANWLKAAGFANVRQIRPVTSPGNVLVTGSV